MKTTKTITREEAVFVCDYCKNTMIFPCKTCLGCGKHTCNNSCNYEYMVEFTGGNPAELSSLRHSFGTGIYLQTMHFCLECWKSDPVAQYLKQIEKLNQSIGVSYSDYRREHFKIADKVLRLISKRELKSNP